MSTQEHEPLINACPDCGEDIDVSAQPPYAKIECPHCHGSIRVRTQLGQYKVQRLLGEGGMSQVFLAVDETLGRSVALKVLHKELSRDEKLTKSFEREAKITASVNHPNVVKVYTVGSDYGYFFIAMELVDNMSLEELITNQSCVPEAKVMQIAHDVTSGLYAAFKAGLIHRDIKPGNILLTNDGSAKLVDFGLAVQTGHHDENEDVWATPFYVPPEKLDGEPDDFRGDIYSLGATLFHAVSGTPPYAANTASLEELKKIKAKTIRLIETAPDSRKRTCRLIDRMMARRPDDRHQTYTELLLDIDDAATKVGGRKRSASGIADLRAEETVTQPVWKSIPVMIAAGVIVLLGLGFLLMSGKEEDVSASLLSGGDDRVLAAGEQSGTALYAEARRLLSDGKRGAAEKGFRRILISADLKEPTRSWAKFNLGLCMLLNGEEKEARSQFQELIKSNDGETLPENIADLIQFFGQAGYALSDDLPVQSDVLPASTGVPYEKIAYLAFALKNWHQSKFESASQFFLQFQTASFPEPYTWIEGLKNQVTAYQQDGEILLDSKLPIPRISMSKEDLQSAKVSLTEARGALKTTGPAVELLDARLARIPLLLTEKERIAALPKDPSPSTIPTTETIADAAASMSIPIPGGLPPVTVPQPTVIEFEPDAKSLAELKKLWKAEEVAQAMGANFKFGQAKSWYEGVVTDLPLLKEMLADEMRIVKRADTFLDLLLNKLNESKYEGAVLRKEGMPLEAKITGATRETLKVNLGFGDNDVSIEDFEPSWLLTVAGDLFNNAEGNPDILGGAICFAWTTGEHDWARKLAKGRENDFPDDFKMMWKRLMKNRPQ